MNLTLDVGCGNTPKGIINCDMFMGVTPHLHAPKNVINPKKIRNFVRADASDLPFRDGIFETVYCYHVLEHLDKPIKAFNELLRVSKRKVIIKLPHRFAREAWFRHKECEMHKHHYNVKILSDFLSKRQLNFEIFVRSKPVPDLPFIRSFLQVPWEIKVVIDK